MTATGYTQANQKHDFNFNDTSAVAAQQITGGFAGEQTTEQVKYVLNSDDVIVKINEFLSGQRQVVTQDKKGKTIIGVVRFAEAIISDEGRSQIIRELEMRLSRIYITSNMDKRQICTISKIFGRSFLKMLYKNRKDYKIDSSNLGMIFHGVVDAVIATLLKSKDKTYLNFLKDTSRMVEMRQFGNKPIPKNVTMFNNK